MIAWTLLAVLLGLLLNWLLAGIAVQPDWSFAILLGAMLAQWRYWRWLLPMACLHDYILYWSIWPSISLWFTLFSLLLWVDTQIGPGMPQRILLLLSGNLTLLWFGWTPFAVVLTMLLTICCWYLFSPFSYRTKLQKQPA